MKTQCLKGRILAATRGETHPGKQQEPIKGAQCNLGDPFSEGKLEGETHLTPQLLTADHYCIQTGIFFLQGARVAVFDG